MSESEQMYLVTIALLCEERGVSVAPLAPMAERLGVLAVSVNQMVRKLEKDGLVEYKPYRGVSLTPTGQEIAQGVLRSRRTWQVFLVERLGYSIEEAEEISCRLEHAVPDETVERLASFLGNPIAAPDGRPIPTADRRKSSPAGMLLSTIGVGQEVVVKEVRAESQVRTLLSGEGITAGATVEVVAVAESGAVLVRNAMGKMVHLSAGLAASIWVEVIKEPMD